MNRTFIVIFAFTSSVVPFLVCHFLEKRYHKQLRTLKEFDGKSYYQCIFFGYKNFKCKPHLLNRLECGNFCSYAQLQRLLYQIASARKTVSLCIYMVTLKQVSDVLVNVSQNGVLVRLITDYGMGKTASSKSILNNLAKNGIQFKTSASYDQMMHHKFCLIDEEDSRAAKAFFGSLNLTAQAFCRNFEAVILTNNQDIILRLSEEFEDLWEQL